MQNGQQVTRECQDQIEVDAYLAYIASNGNWGKGEYQEMVTPEDIIEHPAVAEVLDADGVTVITPAQDAYIEKIPAIYQTIPAEYSYVVEDVSRNIKLDRIRELRKPLLADADIIVNIAYDTGVNITAAKAYRQALRDCTNAYIADATLLDNVDPEIFIFPTKP